MSDSLPTFSNELKAVNVLDDLDIDSSILERLAFHSFKINRMIALHPKASPDLLARLADSPDRLTRRNVTCNPQTSKEVLFALATTFACEFFQNPAFDFLLMEEPDLLFKLPVGVMKNILKRDDCPDSILNWAVKFGDKSHHLAVVHRTLISKERLQLIACGPNVRAAEIAAGRLISGDFVE